MIISVCGPGQRALAIEWLKGSSGCPHTNIVPRPARADGSVDGVCTSCRDESFPLVLSAEEQSFLADYAGECGTFAAPRGLQ